MRTFYLTPQVTMFFRRTFTSSIYKTNSGYSRTSINAADPRYNENNNGKLLFIF